MDSEEGVRGIDILGVGGVDSRYGGSGNIIIGGWLHGGTVYTYLRVHVCMSACLSPTRKSQVEWFFAGRYYAAR